MERIAEIFGHNVRVAREKIGISQAELAQRCSVSRQTVSNWENGSIPNESAISTLAALLNLPEYDLFTHPKYKKTTTEPTIREALTAIAHAHGLEVVQTPYSFPHIKEYLKKTPASE